MQHTVCKKQSTIDGGDPGKSSSWTVVIERTVANTQVKRNGTRVDTLRDINVDAEGVAFGIKKLQEQKENMQGASILFLI